MSEDLVTESVEALAEAIWNASRADEGTISATGANHVAATLISSGVVRLADEAEEDDPDAGYDPDAEHKYRLEDR